MKPLKPTSSAVVDVANLSEEEVLECIDYVVDYLAPGFVFRPFDLDDVKQEGRQAALKSLKGFDPNFKKTGSLQEKLKSYIFTHVKRRLINFKRDEHGQKEDKYNLRNYASSIYGLEDSHESQILVEQNENYIDAKMVTDKILLELEVEYRHDFHKMMSGVTIPKLQREKLFARIKEIILNAPELPTEE